MARFPVLKNYIPTLFAAERLGVTPDCLRRWRITGEGPPYIKVGPKLCRYAVEDLDLWIESRRIQPSKGTK